MSLAQNIREQLLKSFRAELAEHIQTMTEVLLALEQGRADQDMLDNAFRAAHSLKGAARAVGGSAIEQIAHSLENLLDGMRRGTQLPTQDLFTTCYSALDTIQLVQASYEAGETTPPVQALLVLAEMEKLRTAPKATPKERADRTTAPAIGVKPPAAQIPLNEALKSDDSNGPQPADSAPDKAAPTLEAASVQPEPQSLANHGQNNGAMGNGNDETVRVDVQKLDALMASLSELLIARIRQEQYQAQINHLHDTLDRLLKSWAPVRAPYTHLMREQLNGMLSLHRPHPVDTSPNGNGNSWNERSIFHTNLDFENDLSGREYTGDWKHLVEVSKDSAHLLRYVSESQEQISAISQQVRVMSRQHAADTLHLSLVIDELENEIKRMRMLPFYTITGLFARMIRDLAAQSGKEATLTILGGNTEVDKRILEGIKDPLMHLLRNALDHGIEKPDKRQALGKERTGQITLSIEQAGKEVVIRVSDDGAGLDLESIRQAVANQNAKSEILPGALSDTDLIDAIFSMGISTSRIITDVSGRGVGLNVVRNNIESLHGRVDVETRTGEGTSFIMTLPLALTGSSSLLVRCAGQLFAIPISSIERSLHIDPASIFTLEGHDTIQYNDYPVPLVRLSDVLELSDKQESFQNEKKRLSAVVLAIEERRLSRPSSRQVAFLIDELVGEQILVVKNMGEHLSRVAGIAGASVLGSGEVVLILNTVDLVKLAARPNQRSVIDLQESQAAIKENHGHKRILVVDDSITTRTLEKNILEAAGYIVMLAMDGIDALEIVRSNERPDLVVTDIVMPHMDGFELTRQIKEDAQIKSLPVILVTSLDSQADKEHGIEVHADAYIVKSNFDQVNLLETIEQLM